jgi:hypothetical protein
VCAPFFTTGVNELQTLANKLSLALVRRQGEINTAAARVLRDYTWRYVRTAVAERAAEAAASVAAAGARGGPAAAQAAAHAAADALRPELVAAEGLVRLQQRLEAEVAATVAAGGSASSRKALSVHTVTTALCRAMGGGKTVSCKSAKDRTSMIVTWEEARLARQLGVPEPRAKALLSALRGEGVRRANVLKNTGKKKYAFNALQRSVLPDEITPPAYTCSGNTQS